jgi:hypothetical protein
MSQASIKKSGANLHLELATETFDDMRTGTTNGHVPIFQVFIQADPGNTANIYVGCQLTGCHFVLTAGNFISLPINDLNKVCVRAGGDVQRVNWIAMR